MAPAVVEGGMDRVMAIAFLAAIAVGGVPDLCRTPEVSWNTSSTALYNFESSAADHSISDPANYREAGTSWAQPAGSGRIVAKPAVERPMRNTTNLV